MQPLRAYSWTSTPRSASKETSPPSRTRSRACLGMQKSTSAWARRDPSSASLTRLREDHSSIRTSRFSRCVLAAPTVFILFFEYLSFLVHNDSNALVGARIRLSPARQTPLRPILLRRLARQMPLRPIRLLRPVQRVLLRPIQLRRLARLMPLQPILLLRLARLMPLRPILLRRLAQLMPLQPIQLLRLARQMPL